MGVFHYSRHEARSAEVQFAEAIERSGGVYPELYNNLGVVLLEQGRYAEAAACRKIYVDELPLQRREARRSGKERLERALKEQGSR